MTSPWSAPTYDDTYTAAGGHGDLDGVAPSLADVLQIQRLVSSLALRGPLYGQRLGVDTHLILVLSFRYVICRF